MIERKQLGGNQVTDCPSPKKRTAVPPAFFLDAAALSRLGGGLMLPMLVGRHNAPLILVLGFISFPHPPHSIVQQGNANCRSNHAICRGHRGYFPCCNNFHLFVAKHNKSLAKISCAFPLFFCVPPVFSAFCLRVFFTFPANFPPVRPRSFAALATKVFPRRQTFMEGVSGASWRWSQRFSFASNIADL